MLMWLGFAKKLDDPFRKRSSASSRCLARRWRDACHSSQTRVGTAAQASNCYSYPQAAAATTAPYHAKPVAARLESAFAERQGNCEISRYVRVAGEKVNP